MLPVALSVSGLMARCDGRRRLPRPWSSASHVSRRALLIGGLVGAASAGLSGWAASAPIVFPTAAGNRRFSVLYGGGKIGTHTVSFSSAAGANIVDTQIQLQVKGLFGGTVFQFTHGSRETWTGGRLMALVGDTLEGGAMLHVDGAATAQGFRVVSQSGPYMASAATLTSNSLWTPAVLEQLTVVDAEHGGVIGVSSHMSADEQVTVAGRQVRATPYTFITPFIAGTIWYDSNGLWIAGEFEFSGAKIQYQLDS